MGRRTLDRRMLLPTLLNDLFVDLLKKNIDYIEEGIGILKKSLSSSNEKCLFKPSYCRASLLSPNKVIETLITQREHINQCSVAIVECRYSDSKKIKEGLLLISLYICHMLFFLREQAFNDNLVSTFFNYLRKKKDTKGLQMFLEILLGRNIATFKDSTVIEWTDGIGRVVGASRQIIKIFLEQLKDSGRKCKEGSSALGDYITYQDKEIRERITPIRVKRPYGNIGLDVKDEAILALSFYGLPNLDIKIAMSLGISAEAVRKKVIRLKEKPEVKQALGRKAELVRYNLSDDEIGRSKQGKTTLPLKQSGYYDKANPFKE